MKEIMVSVVLTTYNGEKYIKKQLESLVNQTFTIDELVIVDDCSTDNTVLLIDDFLKKNKLDFARLYVNTCNLGYKRNFYHAIELSHGKYIFLCDQDDIWKPNKIATFIDVFKRNNHFLSVNSSLSLIDKDDNLIDEDSTYKLISVGKPLNCLRMNEIVSVPLDVLMKHNVSPGCVTAFTKELKTVFLQAYNFNVPHDYCINLIAGLAGECAFINESTIYYRLHDSNTIGLKFGNSNKSKITGTLQDRINQAEFFHSIIVSLDKQGLIGFKNKAVIQLEKRYNVLMERSRLEKIIYVISHPVLYKKYFSIRQYIGDIIYILRLDGIIRMLQKKMIK